MKRKSIIILMFLVLLISLCACNAEEYRIERQGSRIIEFSEEQIVEPVTNYYTSYSEFTKSELSKINASNSGANYAQFAYTKKYFEDKKLVTFQYTAAAANYYIDSITIDENKVIVNVIAEKTKKTGEKSYMFFGEISETLINPTVEINIIETWQDNVEARDVGFYHKKNDFPVINIAMATNEDELQMFTNYKNDPILIRLFQNFDSAFFEMNQIIMFYEYVYVTTNTSIEYINDTITINSMTTDHYVRNGSMVKDLYLHYFAIPKTDATLNYNFRLKYENDYNVTKEPILKNGVIFVPTESIIK